MKKGKVVSIKRGWVVRTEVKGSALLHVNCDTRQVARQIKRQYKGNRYLKNATMYRTSEVVFGDGQIFISMEKAR